MLAMVGLVAVVLVIAGAGSLILTRNAARQPGRVAAGLRGELDHLVEDRVGVAHGAERRPHGPSSSRTPTSFRSTAPATSSRRCPRD